MADIWKALASNDNPPSEDDPVTDAFQSLIDRIAIEPTTDGYKIAVSGLIGFEAEVQWGAGRCGVW